MLTYFQNSDSKNAVDDATRALDGYMSRIKRLPEVEGGYMTLGDWIDGITEEVREETRKEVREEVREEGIRLLLETMQEYKVTKENAVIKLKEKYPDYADRAEELVDKYWNEN